MPGFIGVIGDKIPFFNVEERLKLIQETLAGKGYCIERRTVNKFLYDKVFAENKNLLLVVDGVILNSRELTLKYRSKNFTECVEKMYYDEGETFFNAFRGSFSGVIYDKIENKWIIYTNHTGDKQVFYSQLNDTLLFGSEMHCMVETLNKNGFPVSINETGVYLVLTHGFVIEDHTLVNEVKKLPAGHYLRYEKNGLEEIQYHRFSNKPNKKMTTQDAIEGIDKFFRNAVRLQFEKDKEYGYKHLTTLSGGLDSRMTVWVAHEMGYKEQLNTTFSQSNYLDFSIAQEIATDLKHDFLFKALDHGNFVKDIDNVTRLTYGNANFFGLSHGKSMYDAINFEPYGIVHTGMIGDAIIGTFFKKNEYNAEVKIGQGAYSLEMIERLDNYKFKYEYENEEIFCLYTRAFTGANQGMVVFQEHTETVSPFCDVDFIEFCYSIPLNLRFNHKIYFDWIFKKYPLAAEYVWEKKRTKIKPIENKELKYMNLFGNRVPSISDERFLKWMIGAILRKVGLREKGAKAKIPNVPNNNNMNPVDYWFHDNKEFDFFITNYFENFQSFISNKQLRTDCQYMFNIDNVEMKLQVISAVAGIKIITKL